MRKRFWPGPFVTALLFAFSSMALAQSIGPGRGLPPYPVRSGVTPSAEQGGEESRPSPAGAVASMKLLAHNVGWAMSMGQLMWTSSGGTEWEDITPPAAKGGVISGVFFLDTKRGWVMLKHGEPDVIGGTQFDLACTDNGGAAWSMRHVTVPERKYPSILNGGVLAFADSVHGWLGLEAGLSSATAGMGVLLATGDGGETWKLATATGWDNDDTVGPMLMLTPEQGWLVGAGGNDPLLATRDGGRTWQKIELESPVKTDLMRKYDRNLQQFERSFQRALTPAEAEYVRKQKKPPRDHSYAAYDLPTFEDPKHGYICVTYPGVVVLFATEDSGVTWKPDRILTGLQEHSMGTMVASAVADSTWITGRLPKDGMPQLKNLGPGASATDSTMPAPEASGVFQMSFVTASQGWVVTNFFKLLSTNDAGATFTDITPSRRPRAATP
jgi:photosystem II stability/assembly factor-like uncharacterized protein